MHPASEAIEWLWDKELARWVSAPPSGQGTERQVKAGTLNRLQVAYEQPHSMSAWNLGEITPIDNLISGAALHAGGGRPPGNAQGGGVIAHVRVG